MTGGTEAAALAAELAQVPDRPARWRFAVGCARAAVFPPTDLAVLGITADRCRLCRGHRLVPGRVSLDRPRLPAALRSPSRR